MVRISYHLLDLSVRDGRKRNAGFHDSRNRPEYKKKKKKEMFNFVSTASISST